MNNNHSDLFKKLESIVIPIDFKCTYFKCNFFRWNREKNVWNVQGINLSVKQGKDILHCVKFLKVPELIKKQTEQKKNLKQMQGSPKMFNWKEKMRFLIGISNNSLNFITMKKAIVTKAGLFLVGMHYRFRLISIKFLFLSTIICRKQFWNVAIVILKNARYLYLCISGMCIVLSALIYRSNEKPKAKKKMSEMFAVCSLWRRS